MTTIDGIIRGKMKMSCPAICAMIYYYVDEFGKLTHSASATIQGPTLDQIDMTS